MSRDLLQRSMLYLNLGKMFKSSVGHCVCSFTRYMVTDLPRHRTVSFESRSAVHGKRGWQCGLFVCSERERATVVNSLASEISGNSLL